MELIRSLNVLHFQEHLALAWCSEKTSNEHGQTKNTNSQQTSKIRATIDHVIQNGFLRCHQKFILTWTAASISADGLQSNDRERIKNQLNMCIKSAKMSALNMLDQLKFECFYKTI